MKCATVFVLLAAMLVAASALPRERRSPRGKIVIDQPIGRDPSISAGFEKKVYENRHGSIVAYGEGSKSPDRKAEATGGIRGQFEWGGSRDLTARERTRLAEITRNEQIERAERERLSRQ